MIMRGSTVMRRSMITHWSMAMRGSTVMRRSMMTLKLTQFEIILYLRTGGAAEEHLHGPEAIICGL